MNSTHFKAVSIMMLYLEKISGVWGQRGMTTHQQFGSMSYSILSQLQLNNFIIALKLWLPWVPMLQSSDSHCAILEHTYL